MPTFENINRIKLSKILYLDINKISLLEIIIIKKIFNQKKMFFVIDRILVADWLKMVTSDHM